MVGEGSFLFGGRFLPSRLTAVRCGVFLRYDWWQQIFVGGTGWGGVADNFVLFIAWFFLLIQFVRT